MSGESLEANVQEMAKLLETRKKHHQRTVLFLGSRAGGLFRSYKFYDTLQVFSKRSFTSMSRIERFGECYNLLQQGLFSELDLFNILSSSLHVITASDAERGILRSDAKHGIMLSDADLSLAELVKDQFFDLVISTNIDNIVEQAFDEVGMRELEHFLMLTPGPNTDLGVIYAQKDVCWLIKVFGDLSSRRYNILSRKNHLENTEHPQLRGFLNRNLAGDILVVGLDPTWDAGILAAFPAGGGHYWFINEEHFADNSQVAGTWGGGRSVKFILGGEGSYENFLKGLYWYLGKGKVPGSSQSSQLIHDIYKKVQAIPDDFAQQLQEVRREIEHLRREILKSPSSDGK